MEFATSATQTSKVNSETLYETRFVFQDSDNSASPLPSTKVSHIKPIEEDQDQNESTLNRTWYNIYDSDMHVTEEKVKMGHINESSKAIIESVNSTSNEDIREAELFETKAEIKVEFNDEEEITYNIEIDVSEEKCPIKSEPADTIEEQEVIDNSNLSEVNHEGSEVLGSEKNQIDQSITKTINVRKYENTTTVNSCVSDPRNIGQTISTRTRNVNSNNLVSNETKSLKKLFICDTCNKSFHCKANLVRHILNHPKSYSCSYCNYKTFKKGTLKGHTNSQHTKSIIFSCSDCNYTAYYKSGLNRHINSQHTKSTVLNCSYCNYKSYNRDALNKHVNAKHTMRTSFSCSYCSHKTHRKWDLDQHINSRHTKSIVFNCSYCSYKTPLKWNLDKHINSQHTKSTVFNCSYCIYQTHRKWNLDQHINSQHTKSTVFNCSYCDYKSYEKGALKRHLKMKHSLST